MSLKLLLSFTLLIIAGKTVKGDITLGQMAMFLLAFRQEWYI